ncbi:xanthine dehydrogenase family protein molybdopterin-binding subunit [Tahibacter amnicola]|uniref:Molybdopterin-dependent oxidoreductase n=1 Tax=Tahibacter amnicola TaxID=2976241 RepID=A0ABY6BFZ4_9GAMM|nr:molybdopterin cofactor-binding domain-containing protein [Tahibacter amnicola]UXI68789.1 molybdopterin-dependent oxidoreductase [Tahibacter amnicola]
MSHDGDSIALPPHPDRRRFLKAGVAVAALASLRVGLALPRAARRLGAFVEIGADGSVSLTIHRSEMGQGVRTSLALVLAQALDVPWSSVRVVQGDADAQLGDQNTEGSYTIRSCHAPLRQAAGKARAALMEAAAQRWGTKAATLDTDAGAVVRPGTRHRIPYADLVAVAAARPLPQKEMPKPLSPGMPATLPRRIDGDDIVRGKARFGIDIQLPEQRFAVLVRAPFPAQRIVRIDDARARAVSGVEAVLPLEAQAAPANSLASVAVIARTTWAAIKAARLLTVQWSQAPTWSEAMLEEATAQALPVQESGSDAGTSDGDTLSLTYTTAMTAHAPLEPPMATARYAEGRCEIWAPTQNPQLAQKLVARALGMEPAKVTVHVTLLGGSFGRKAQQDFVVEAALLARQVAWPVQVLWRREDEFSRGYFRPASRQQLAITLDAEGRPQRWDHRVAFASVATVEDPAATRHADWELEELRAFPYRVARQRFHAAAVKAPVRVAWQRSVASWHLVFAIQSAIGEIALRRGLDPIALQLALIDHQPDHSGPPSTRDHDRAGLDRVLRRLRDELARTHAEGVIAGHACAAMRGSFVALAARVTVAGNDTVRLVGFDAVVDCGRVIHADLLRQQIEGGVLYGLSDALYGRIALTPDGAEQSNFHQYRLLRMAEAVPVRVHILASSAPPTGAGELATPVVAPALANAIAAATGRRHRDLPLGNVLAL